MSFDMTHMTSIANLMAINVETPKIDSECFLERELTKLIHLNQVDSNGVIRTYQSSLLWLQMCM